MKPLKLALIGAGQRGQFAYAPYMLSHPDEAVFVAVAEPDEGRRASFQRTFGLDDSAVFKNDDEFLKAGVEADAVLLCTQDRQHHDMALRVLKAGYHLLLEKPMSPDARECLEMERCAEQNNRILVVCHVLRYTKFFIELKKQLDSGVIGDLVCIHHCENVGFWHMAHSFVRGNWRDADVSSPMILQKSCHDMDILLYLVGSPCARLSSFGSLRHFNSASAPKGSAQRCLDCKVEAGCPYSALKIYLHSGRKGWPVSVLTPDPTPESITQALRDGPYGRCVYHCDNNVVDHQTTSLEFENGVTAAFTMSAFTHDISRTIKLMGTRGEIMGHMEKGEIEIHDFASGDKATIAQAPPSTGHSGGDAGLMGDFLAILRAGQPVTGKSSAKASVHSHLMALAAEASRVSGRVIALDEFEKSLG